MENSLPVIKKRVEFNSEDFLLRFILNIITTYFMIYGQKTDFIQKSRRSSLCFTE